MPDRCCKKVSQFKITLFRDIKDCHLPKEDMSGQMPKNWQHGFFLITTERTYFLMAKTIEDRNMWMAGFRYLIASTVTVQNIMRDNSRLLDQKIKERTQKIVEKAQRPKSKKKKNDKEEPMFGLKRKSSQVKALDTDVQGEDDDATFVIGVAPRNKA